MFKFYSGGTIIFSSDNLEEVEAEALKFKTENNLKVLEIIRGRGKFYKWV